MKTPSSEVNFTLDDKGIARITLNIPARHNALSGDNIQQFCDHLDHIASQPDIRVLIISGAGDKTFCAGAALGELGSGSFSGDRFVEIPDRLAALTIPTICAFNGSAYGGGTEIGLACDFRIGTPSMRLFVPPARIGLCYPVNGIERFVQTLGVTTAKRLLLASEEFSGNELLELDYLTHLVNKPQLETTAAELAERMAGYAPLALKAMKQICQQTSNGTLDKTEANALAEHCNQSEDLKEGFRAREEKRTPVFSGK